LRSKTYILIKDSLLGVSILNSFWIMKMSRSYYHSECVYLDTNIISIIIEHPEWYSRLFNFLFENHFYIAFSDVLLTELSQAKRKHNDFNTLFTILPSAEIKSFETIIEEEVKLYPKTRTDNLLFRSANLELDQQTINRWLSSDETKAVLEKQLLRAKRMRQHLEIVKTNFPPSNQGKYSIGQAEIFAWMVTAQWLKASYPDFMRKLNDNKRLLKAKVFSSIQLFAYYVYYKYYLDNRRPKELSDFGCLFHLFYFPYCKLVVVERGMCTILSKIKLHSKVLDNVEVKTVDFLSNNQIFKK
jgi:predicted nucleic acid-binding protein